MRSVQRALEEIEKKFPNGFEYPPCDAKFIVQLKTIVDAISQDQTLKNTGTPSKETQELISQFRKDFLPKDDTTQGHHFNLNYLIEAFNTYVQNFKPWIFNQQSLFWRQVIGYLERLVPVVDAQSFCWGGSSFIEGKQPQPRSLLFYNYQSGWNILYFSSRMDAHGSELGIDFAIEMRHFGPGYGRKYWRELEPTGFVSHYTLGDIVKAKTTDLDNLQKRLKQQCQEEQAQPAPVSNKRTTQDESIADRVKKRRTQPY